MTADRDTGSELRADFCRVKLELAREDRASVIGPAGRTSSMSGFDSDTFLCSPEFPATPSQAKMRMSAEECSSLRVLLPPLSQCEFRKRDSETSIIFNRVDKATFNFHFRVVVMDRAHWQPGDSLASACSSWNFRAGVPVYGDSGTAAASDNHRDGRSGLRVRLVLQVSFSKT